jgi:hypothetical protein
MFEFNYRRERTDGLTTPVDARRFTELHTTTIVGFWKSLLHLTSDNPNTTCPYPSISSAGRWRLLEARQDVTRLAGLPPRFILRGKYSK